MSLRIIAVFALVLAACGGEKALSEEARTDYLQSCALCHAADGSGRTPGDPDNESGMPMPPRGGDPRLTDDDLAAIVVFLRTLSP